MAFLTRMLSDLRSFLRRDRSSTVALAEAVVLLGLIGITDFVTGYQTSLALFYAAPILVCVYWCDRWTAYVVAILTTFTWCVADLTAGHFYPNSAVHAWEILVRLVFFILVAMVGCAIKQRGVEANTRISLLEHARRLEHQIVEISEYEQRRIGQDLHDGLCQYLAALACSATALKSDLEKAALPKFAAAAEDLAQLLRAGINQTRNLARGLMPLHIDQGGLNSALQDLTTSSSRLLGIQCTLHHTGEPPIRDNGRAMHLYRIAQEAINNATRHGKAQHVNIALSSNPEATVLSIADDGVGICNTTKNLNGMGLSVMKYRSKLMGGELLIEDRPAGGTVISCTVRQNALREEAHAVPA